MENITFICRFCKQERKNGNSLRNHERLCKENPNRQGIEEYTRTEKWYEAMKSFRSKGGTRTQIHPKGDFTCRFCGQSFFNKRLESKTQHENHCKENPNRVEYKNSGRKLTEEQKRKISETQKRNFKESGAKSIWHTQLEKRKSYAEEYFDKCFPELKQNYHVDRYFLDLANPEKKLYIEIDGEQHYNDQKVVEHDKVRTQRLEELGWTCIQRIRWSKYKKLSKDEQEVLIESLRNRTIGGVVTTSVS